MSVKVMTLVYDAHFYDQAFLHRGKKKKTGEEYEKVVVVKASNLKWVCNALADHANDEGEGAYPSISTIADKTDLTRPTVVYCLQGLKVSGVVSVAGISKYRTVNYTVNKAILKEWAKRERWSDLSKDSKATLLTSVKPLYGDGKATLPEPSFNRQRTVAVVPPAPVPATAPDPLDGFLGFERMKLLGGENEEARLLKDRVSDFPEDCQQTLMWFVELWQWPAASIPEKPARGGGQYAAWIKEIRDINEIIKGFGKRALLACVDPCANISVSRPAAINWCLPGEVGKLRKSADSTPASAPVTEFTKILQQPRVPLRRPVKSENQPL